MSEQVPDPTIQEPPPTKRTRRRRHRGRRIALIVLAALVVVVGGGIALLRPQVSVQEQPRTLNFTAPVTKSTQSETVGLSGTLAPKTESELNFPVSGTVTKVYVSAGDKVKKGQKLARIDDTDLRSALALAKANRDTAQANLDDVDNRGTAAAITAAKAQVKSAKAAVSSAQDDLDHAILRSPIAGTVAAVDLGVGDTVSAGSGGSGASGLGNNAASGTSTSQVVVISTDSWKLDGSVGSSDLGKLKAGQTVAVVPSGARRPISGKVSSIGIVATASSDGAATFPVVVALDGTHPDLFSGTTAAATITVAEYPEVLTVPTVAITTSDGKSVVNKVTGDSTTPVEVGIGRVFGETTEITSGLADGDIVQVNVTLPAAAEASQNGGFPGFGGPRMRNGGNGTRASSGANGGSGPVVVTQEEPPPGAVAGGGPQPGQAVEGGQPANADGGNR